MDEIETYYGKDIEDLATIYSSACNKMSDIEYIEDISIIAEEVFRGDANVYRIATFMAFVRNLIRIRPDKKYELYEKTFECLYKSILNSKTIT